MIWTIVYGPTSVLQSGARIKLLTPEQVKALPVGDVLYNIFGEEVTVSYDMDMDTREGYTAYGTLFIEP